MHVFERESGEEIPLSDLFTAPRIAVDERSVSLSEFAVNQPETEEDGSPDAHYGECDALRYGKNAASCHEPA